MYAQYRYLPNATQANILNDLVAILTGVVDVNALSASCDKANSAIVGTVAAGWTLADAAAGVNAKALTAPLVDDPTKLKTIVLDINGASNLLLKLYESWNATTHVGTNLSNLSDSVTYAPAYNKTNGGTLFISASARHCAIASFDSLQTTFSPPVMVVEHTRNDSWNTVANGYPCSAFVPFSALCAYNSNPNISTPRTYNPNTGTDVTGANAYMGMYSPLQGVGSSAGGNGSYGSYIIMGASLSPAGLGANASKQMAHLLVPLGISRNSVFAVLGGDISANCGIYMTTSTFGSVTDEITVGADTYVVWTSGAIAGPAGQTLRIAIKKA